jgi:hypothetical protein
MNIGLKKKTFSLFQVANEEWRKFEMARREREVLKHFGWMNISRE